MLVKVNRINDEGKVISVTKLDIDDYGSVIPLEELELKLPLNEDVAEVLRNSQYAVLSVQGNMDEDGSTIITAETMTLDELNREKQNTVDVVEKKKQDG
jgi:hypothetical protein